MSNQRPDDETLYNLLPLDVEGFDSLAELALDMRWSWDHVTDEVWRQLDPVLWDLTPEVCHLNEEHASFAVLERARTFMEEAGQPLPTAWVARMRESMALLTPRFSANRAVREYTEQHYLPAALSYRKRAEKKGAAGRRLVDWLRAVEQQWAALHFGEVKPETSGEQHVFEVQVYLNDLNPGSLLVELHADGVDGAGAVHQQMERVRKLTGASGGYVYRAAVSAARLPTDYTARVLPRFDGVAIPLENARILWQR